MKKVTISFPQIVIEQKEIEISEEEYEDLAEGSSDEKADFIWSRMTDQERQWTQGKKWVEGAIDNGYCGVVE